LEITIVGATTLVQFSFIFTATVTVVGWFVVAAMTDRREFRKEVREYVKDAKASCEAVRIAAHDYWLISDKKSSAASAVVLKAEVGNLARQIQIIGTLGLQISPACVANVRQCATGGDFEKADRKRTGADQERMADVAGSLQDLITDIDVAFYSKFRPRSDRSWLRFVPLIGLLATAKDG